MARNPPLYTRSLVLNPFSFSKIWLNISDPAAGASDDWYKGSLGTRYAFTTELRDTGYHGFELPADQIIESGEEIVAGMKVIFNKIIQDTKEP